MEIKFTDTEIDQYCLKLSLEIIDNICEFDNIYPIPMRGYPVAIKLSKILSLPISIKLEKKSLVVDALIDSDEILQEYKNNKKAALFVKNNKIDDIDFYVEKKEEYIIFPWEEKKNINNIIIQMLEYIGEDPTREGLLETPARIIKSWDTLYGGYKKNASDIMKVFEEGACDEMVVLKNIEFYSMCEHHLLPFFGKISIGYMPDKRVIGVSKLARLVDIYARRMQIQERLVNQIANDIMEYLEPLGVIVIAEAQHMCMSSRGVEKQKSKMITSSLRGIFKEEAIVRQEFFSLIR